MIAAAAPDLHVERRGSGPTILMIHGATLDHRMWRPQVEALAERYQVITYDVRGHGRSPMPTGPFKHYEDAEALVDHLGVGPVVAIGHTIGALYALELALARPELVAAFGALCMSGLGIPPFPDDHIQTMTAIRNAARTEGVAAAKALWLDTGWVASARAVPAVAAEVGAILADYTGWYWTHDSAVKNLDPPAAGRLEQLRVPALVVDGGLDLAYNHAVADELARRIPRAKLLRLPAAGHMANLEDPAAVTRAIDALARSASSWS
jgi:3-oxoadipate enol-lactonase